jgi:hypothetical protein
MFQINENIIEVGPSSKFIYQFVDEPVEITFCKEGIAKFRTNGSEGTETFYVDLHTGHFTQITGNEVFDTVPIEFSSMNCVGKTIKD